MLAGVNSALIASQDRFCLFPESVCEGFSFSRLIAGEKLRHRPASVPAVYLRSFAFWRPSGAQPAARIPMLRTDFGLPRSQPENIPGITGPYYGGINGRFGGSCWTASNCAPWKFSVIRSPPPVFFGANFVRLRLGFLR